MESSKPILIGVLFAVFLALAIVVRIQAQNTAITIDKSKECAVFDADLNIFTTANYKAVVTKNKNGSLMLQCKASGVPNTTGKVVTYDYENTNIPCVFKVENDVKTTKNWKEVLSVDGTATYVCYFD